MRDAVRNLGVGFAAEAYEQYLQLSLAALVYMPAGRWREADAVLAAGESTVSASGRLVWLWLVTGQALRRGDLELTDRHLPELCRTALASEEPQRILPMACVAMPRALLAGKRGTVEELADIVLTTPGQWLMTSSMLAIVRSLAAVEDRDPSRATHPYVRRARRRCAASDAEGCAWSPCSPRRQTRRRKRANRGRR